MTAPHLSDAEIAEITEPLTQGAARVRFFKRLGVKVTLKPNGQPIVSRYEYAAAIGAPGEKLGSLQATDPDWAALEARQRKPAQPARP